jgi:ATP-dependent Clp protease adaptor protein ClpS
MSTETISRPKIEVKTKLQPPNMYNVYILNDDKTTFEHVIYTLMEIFHHEYETAEKITLAVHHDGKGLAGTFPYEVAETKVNETIQLAEAAGFPLKATAVEEK